MPKNLMTCARCKKAVHTGSCEHPRCPCFLHYNSAEGWGYMTCACECDVPHERYVSR